MNDFGFEFMDKFKVKDEETDYPIFFIYQKKIVVLIRSLLESGDPTILGVLQKNFTNKQFEFLLFEAMRYGEV